MIQSISRQLPLMNSLPGIRRVLEQVLSTVALKA